MTIALRKTMTREQFFNWAEAQEVRYEFDGEQPVAMTGGTNNHSLLVVNILAELRSRLRGGRCRVLAAEGGGVATVGQTVRYPDATVTCSPVVGTNRLVPNPVVVFEVISERTARTDRVLKMREYAATPSIRRYVIVEQTSPVLLSFVRRDEDAWSATSLSLGDTLSLPEIGVDLPVDAIFEGIDTPQPDQGS